MQDRIKLPRVFWVGLKSIGLTPGAVLRRSNLPPTVYSGESLVTTAQSFAIWRAIRELSNDPRRSAGNSCSQVETDQYHPTLLAALHARTYRDSIERLARYKQLCSAEEFRITQKGDEIVVEVSWPFAGEPAPALLIDAVFALVTELGRRGTKTRLNPKRIELTRPAERANRFEEYFGCRVKYRATRDALILRAADLEIPFVTHNDELLQMLAPQFEHELISSGRPSRPIGWLFRISFMASGSLASISVTIGVSIVPGHTALTRIPREAYSSAALRVRPMTPCLPAW